MELTVLGCSGSYGAPPLGACSGYLVRAGGTTVWVDAGNGTFPELQRHLPVEELTAVVLTHRHPDHCVDLYGLHVCLEYGLGRTDVPVYAAPEVRAVMEPLVGADWGRSFEWREIADGGHLEIGSLTLRFSRTDHPPPTLAVEFRAPSGKRLVYTSDTGPDWSPGVFGAGADLVLSEASYQDAHFGSPIHLSARQAGERARDARARRLMITHIWPTLDPAVSIEEAAAGFGAEVLLASPRLALRV